MHKTKHWTARRQTNTFVLREFLSHPMDVSHWSLHIISIFKFPANISTCQSKRSKHSMSHSITHYRYDTGRCTFPLWFLSLCTRNSYTLRLSTSTLQQMSSVCWIFFLFVSVMQHSIVNISNVCHDGMMHGLTWQQQQQKTVQVVVEHPLVLSRQLEAKSLLQIADIYLSSRFTKMAKQVLWQTRLTS